MPEDRRLAAIMFTDIVGYTALMGSDEDKAFDTLKRNHTIHENLINKYKGTLIKEIGDGTLASFPLASDAVRCGMEIQKECKEQDIPLKIGIHQGEMVLAGADVLGDGVNIASRLQEASQEGCITISGKVYSDIRNKAGIKTKYIGEKKLKNVDDPVKVYEVLYEDEKKPEEEKPLKAKIRTLHYIIVGIVIILAAVIIWQVFPTKETIPIIVESEKDEIDRSIAVLPFVNLSNDPEQEYFSDGMMDEILMHLNKIGDLMVTSRTSVMRYKGTTQSIREIAQELGVAHILEGSVRKAGDKVRIIVQLIDADTDQHLWSESYDRELKDVFAIQSDVAQQVARTLKAEISPEVKERIELRPTVNHEAYNLALQAYSHVRRGTEEGFKKAEELLEKAIQIDPKFASAYAHLGTLKQSGAAWRPAGVSLSPQEAMEIAKPYYFKALEIDENNIPAHIRLSWMHLWYEWDFEKAEKEYMKVIELQPNYSWTDFLISSGRFAEALEGAKKGIEIDPMSAIAWSNQILSYYFMNQSEKAIQTIEMALNSDFKEPNLYLESFRVYSYLERHEDVIKTVNRFFNEYPDTRAPRALGALTIAYYHTGQIEKESEILAELKQMSEINAGGSPSFFIAMIYAQMGEIDLAFEWLEKAYETHEVEIYWLKVEPPFKPLHYDPRWQEILNKVGFPS